MTVEKKIITIGGGGFTHNQDNDQDKFILDHINKKKCSREHFFLFIWSKINLS